MAEERWTLRTWFMMLMGFGITLLFVMGLSGLWKHNFRETIIVLAVGTGLTLLFYRKKLTILAAAACAWLLVNAGFTAVFHPSAIGILLSVAALVGLVLFCWRVNKQYRNLRPDDWQKVFEKN